MINTDKNGGKDMKIKQQTKKEQRFLATNAVRCVENKAYLSEKIIKNVISLDEYINCDSIAIYRSLENEADTKFLFQNAFASGKKVAAPIMEGEDLHLVYVDDNTAYTKGLFGVQEPIEGNQALQVQVIIVPMVAFDKKGNRLGHGKGCFDKFLSDKKIIKIGIAFACQELPALTVSPLDVKMDIIITEEGIVYRNIDIYKQIPNKNE